MNLVTNEQKGMLFCIAAYKQLKFKFLNDINHMKSIINANTIL